MAATDTQSRGGWGGSGPLPPSSNSGWSSAGGSGTGGWGGNANAPSGGGGGDDGGWSSGPPAKGSGWVAQENAASSSGWGESSAHHSSSSWGAPTSNTPNAASGDYQPLMAWKGFSRALTPHCSGDINGLTEYCIFDPLSGSSTANDNGNISSENNNGVKLEVRKTLR